MSALQAPTTAMSMQYVQTHQEASRVHAHLGLSVQEHPAVARQATRPLALDHYQHVRTSMNALWAPTTAMPMLFAQTHKEVSRALVSPDSAALERRV